MIYFMTHLPSEFPMLLSYEGDDLRAAFEEFVDEAWKDDIQPAIAVWDGNFLVAQVLPVYNEEIKEFEPVMVEIPPPSRGAALRVECSRKRTSGHGRPCPFTSSRT